MSKQLKIKIKKEILQSHYYSEVWKFEALKSASLSGTIYMSCFLQ